MRDKIAEIINQAILSYHSPTHQPYDAADKILELLKEQVSEFSALESLVREQGKIISQLPSLDGIVVEEKCKHPTTIRKLTKTANAYDIHTIVNCPFCKSTGTITRPAEWGDIDLKVWISLIQKHEFLFMPNYRKELLSLLITKSGGRLKVKE